MNSAARTARKTWCDAEFNVYKLLIKKIPTPPEKSVQVKVYTTRTHNMYVVFGKTFKFRLFIQVF